MNKELYRKLLAKMDLKDMVDEVKKDHNLLCKLALSIFKKSPELLATIISDAIEHAIKTNNVELSNLLKEEIMDLDNNVEISINTVAKKKTKTSDNVPDNDPCGRGSGYRSC